MLQTEVLSPAPSLDVHWPDVVLDPVAEPGEQDDEDPARAADDQQRGEVLEDVLQQGEAGGQHAGTLCRYVSVCV